MGIGYLLLYGALAVVALWLVAELLLQNRAPLHWRALALAGFLGVAGGMALGSVPVIGAGAAMFAVGQVFVTLSVKRGYGSGWSLRKADGTLPGPLAKVPLLGALTGGAAAVAAAAAAADRIGEVSAVEEAVVAVPVAVAEELPAVEQTAAFQMQELAQDGVYASGYYEQQQPAQDPYAGAYQSGYDIPQQQQQQPQPDAFGYEQQQQQQQQWQGQQQPAFAYDQGYGGYQQQPAQPDPYGGYAPQQDQYGGYQQQPQPDAYGYEQQQQQQQPEQQQWQPEPGIPPQPTYDYGYQQQPTWQQQG
ncbi:hypothetical protein ACFVVX_02300 [Kitasatospora sp. NPDC058170]|uniref:hypothetical protein n=1 Tax=Kitasatospora sp. NPDC058170 TaxID=3346364 RepID=UPI0036D97D7E